MVKKVDPTKIAEQFESQGFLMLGEYVKKDKGILCQVVKGRYEGYLAEVTPAYIQQRIRKNAEQDIKLTALIPRERKRYMDNETQKRGYTIVEYPEDYSPTKPMKIRTPEGKVTNTPKWNGFLVNLERGFDKAQGRRNDTAEQLYIQRYAIWEDAYDTFVTGNYSKAHDKVSFIFKSGEFEGLTGEMENAGIRDMREPNLRSLTHKSLLQYYVMLCEKRGLRFLSIQDKEQYRSRAVLFCEVVKGKYKGYYCTVSVPNLRDNTNNPTFINSLKQVTVNERKRLVKDIIEGRNMIVVDIPNEITARSVLTVACAHGHKYKAKWYQIFQGGGWCPDCKASSGEQLVSLILDKYQIDYIQEYRVLTTGTKNPQFFDFFLPDYNIAIEYNGEQHYSPVNYFGGDKVFDYLQSLDRAKRNYCKKHKIVFVELAHTLSDTEVEESLKKAIDKQTKTLYN